MSHLGSKDFRPTLQVLEEQRSNIQKGLYGDSIVKSEGSRGGKVIGHTKSGKPIYADATHEAHKNFSIAEHDDAINAHQKVRDDYHQNHQSTDKDKQDNDHAYEQQKHHIGAKNGLMKDMTPAQARAAAKESEEKNTPSKKIETDGHGTHSIEHKGSKYWSKPGESKEDFSTRAKQAIKDDHKDEVHIEKSEDGDIEKAEGSRGGKVIGHTKSGKPIYGTKWISHSNVDKLHSKHPEIEDPHYAGRTHIGPGITRESQIFDVKAGDKTYLVHSSPYDGDFWYEKDGDSIISGPGNESEEEAAKMIEETSKLQREKGTANKVRLHKSNDTDLVKALEVLGLGDLIEKSEGSRGGHIIGHTKTGKPVYAVDKTEGKAFEHWTPAEHRDAAALHKQRAKLAVGDKKSDHEWEADSHEEEAADKEKRQKS